MRVWQERERVRRRCGNGSVHRIIYLLAFAKTGYHLADKRAGSMGVVHQTLNHELLHVSLQATQLNS